MPKMANICDFCLKSGILCPKCQSKLRSGKVTDVDLKVGRLLLSLESAYPPLQEIRFYRALVANDVLAVIVGRGDVARLLSYGGKIIRELGEKVGKTVRVLEHGVDERKFLEDLFAPMSVFTINTIWLPDGTTETRVILRKRRRRMKSLLINVDALKEIAKKVRGITLRVEFAR